MLLDDFILVGIVFVFLGVFLFCIIFIIFVCCFLLSYRKGEYVKVLIEEFILVRVVMKILDSVLIILEDIRFLSSVFMI